jgi:hypothetical protein
MSINDWELRFDHNFSQLLNFFKMSFYLFSVCSVFAVAILMPVNWKVGVRFFYRLLFHYRSRITLEEMKQTRTTIGRRLHLATKVKAGTGST